MVTKINYLFPAKSFVYHSLLNGDTLQDCIRLLGLRFKITGDSAFELVDDVLQIIKQEREHRKTVRDAGWMTPELKMLDAVYKLKQNKTKEV